MDFLEIKNSLSGLCEADRLELLEELEQLSVSSSSIPKTQKSRRYMLDNKMGCCLHCSHIKYVRFGIDKGSQRYKCKCCKRSFTEYTGTWMAGLQRKDKIDDYLVLMMEEKSLDKIKVALSIKKQLSTGVIKY